MSSYPPLSPEQLALLPHDNAGPTLLIVSWVLTGLATAFLGLRVYCKLIGHRGLYWDDWILIVAWVALIVDDALATYLVESFGFGKHSWDLPPTFDISKFLLVIEVRATFTLIAIAYTKTAFAITLLRLTEGWTKRFIWFVIVSVNIALGLSALLGWVQCTPIAKAWTPSMSGKCFSENVLIDYAIFGGAYSAAMDFTLALLPWKIIWALQMKRVEKIGVAVAMSMGVAAGAVAIVKAAKLPKLNSPDLYGATDLVMWDITESCVTMIAACIPVLRILLREVRASTRRYYITEEQNATQLSKLQSRNITSDGKLSQGTSSKPTSSGGEGDSMRGFAHYEDKRDYASSD